MTEKETLLARLLAQPVDPAEQVPQGPDGWYWAKLPNTDRGWYCEHGAQGGTRAPGNAQCSLKPCVVALIPRDGHLDGGQYARNTGAKDDLVPYAGWLCEKHAPWWRSAPPDPRPRRSDYD